MARKATVTKAVTKKCNAKPQKKELKLSHKLFVAEYINNGGNATKAYMDTYADTSYEAAMVSAKDLLRNPLIKENIDKRLFEKTKKIELSSEDAKRVLKEIIELDPIDFFDPDTNVPLPLRDIHTRARKYLDRFEIESEYDEDGNETGKRYKYWFNNDKLKATDQLHRLLGLYQEVQSIHEKQFKAAIQIVWEAIREDVPDLIPKIAKRIMEMHSQVDPSLFDPDAPPVIVINRG